MVFNTGPYTVLPDNSILITANMQSETGFPSSHQLKSCVASKSRLKLAARAVLSADAGLLVDIILGRLNVIDPCNCAKLIQNTVNHYSYRILKSYSAVSLYSSAMWYENDKER